MIDHDSARISSYISAKMDDLLELVGTTFPNNPKLPLIRIRVRVRGGSRIFLGGGPFASVASVSDGGSGGACPPEKIEYLGGGVGTLLEVWDPSGWGVLASEKLLQITTLPFGTS